tara:strand:- start:588 stop:1445 length:858 start_codon:yes stop_codon:yes gene_type:complete
MIYITFVEKSEEHPLGQVKIDINETADWILDPDQFPLKLTVFENNKKVWEDSLNYSTSWATWDPLNRDCVIKIETSDGMLLREYTPEPDICQQIFDVWGIKNKGSKGLVVGTHDGSSGEWVKSVQNGNLDAVLVEGSEKQFSKLKENYPNQKCIRNIVTPNGGNTKFYEFGTGEGNTTDTDYLSSQGITDYTIIEEQSIGINELIIQEGNNIEWLHLDLEGIDDTIIMSLDFDRIKKPRLIIFEVINFSPGRIGTSDRIDKVINWLNHNGYEVKYDYWNALAYLV